MKDEEDEGPDGFKTADFYLNPSCKTREEELEDIVNKQAAEIEGLRNAPVVINNFGPGSRPAERSAITGNDKLALFGKLNDLLKKIDALEGDLERANKEIAINTAANADYDFLKDAMKKMQEDIDCQARSIILLSEKISNPKEGPAAKKHLDTLFKTMQDRGLNHIPFSKAARILEISKRRAYQLEPYILKDGRFEIAEIARKRQIRLSSRKKCW